MIVLIVQFPDRFLELLEVVGEDVINVGRDVQLIIAYHTDYSLDPLMILRPHIHHLPLSCQRFHHWRIDEVAQKELLRGTFFIWDIVRAVIFPHFWFWRF